jgi:hypothetical protein
MPLQQKVYLYFSRNIFGVDTSHILGNLIIVPSIFFHLKVETHIYGYKQQCSIRLRKIIVVAFCLGLL